MRPRIIAIKVVPVRSRQPWSAGRGVFAAALAFGLAVGIVIGLSCGSIADTEDGQVTSAPTAASDAKGSLRMFFVVTALAVTLARPTAGAAKASARPRVVPPPAAPVSGLPSPVLGVPHLEFVPQARHATAAAREAGHRVDALARAMVRLRDATEAVQEAGPGQPEALAELDRTRAAVRAALAATLPAIHDALEGADLTADHAPASWTPGTASRSARSRASSAPAKPVARSAPAPCPASHA